MRVKFKLTSFVELGSAVKVGHESGVLEVDPDEEFLIVLLLQKLVEPGQTLVCGRSGLFIRLIVGDVFLHQLEHPLDPYSRKQHLFEFLVKSWLATDIAEGHQ